MEWLPFGTAALGIVAFTPSTARFRSAPWWIILLGSMIGGSLGPVVFYFLAIPDWGSGGASISEDILSGFGYFLLVMLVLRGVQVGLVVGAVALLGRRLLRKTG